MGWNELSVFGSVALYLSWVGRWSLTTVIIFYKITNIEELRGKSLVKKLTPIWVASVFVFVASWAIGDIMENFAIFVALYCLAIPLVLSRKVMRCLSVEYHIDVRW